MSIKNAVPKDRGLIQFIQYDGENIQEIAYWVGKPYDKILVSNPMDMFRVKEHYQYYIELTVGKMPIKKGDYIIKAALSQGFGFFLYKEHIFEAIYSTIEL